MSLPSTRGGLGAHVRAPGVVSLGSVIQRVVNGNRGDRAGNVGTDFLLFTGLFWCIYRGGVCGWGHTGFGGGSLCPRGTQTLKNISFHPHFSHQETRQGHLLKVWSRRDDSPQEWVLGPPSSPEPAGAGAWCPWSSRRQRAAGLAWASCRCGRSSVAPGAGVFQQRGRLCGARF